MASVIPTSAQLFLRIAAALPGGYAFCWGFVALGTAACFAAGMSFHDAEHLFRMLAFLLYPVLFLCSFLVRDLRWLWGLLLTGAVVMTGLATVIQSMLLH